MIIFSVDDKRLRERKRQKTVFIHRHFSRHFVMPLHLSQYLWYFLGSFYLWCSRAITWYEGDVKGYWVNKRETRRRQRNQREACKIGEWVRKMLAMAVRQSLKKIKQLLMFLLDSVHREMVFSTFITWGMHPFVLTLWVIVCMVCLLDFFSRSLSLSLSLYPSACFLFTFHTVVARNINICNDNIE